MKPILLFILLLIFVPAYAADPCTTATENCTEWVSLADQARSLVYRTYSLEKKNDKIKRVLIMVHGAGRDANNYFRTATTAGFLAQALEDTLIIAPRFASNDGGCRDTLAANEISWPCGGNSWRAGGISPSHGKLTSFDLMDEIVRRVARKQLFPNLQAIVISGHSAGGQYVTRYEMANQVHNQAGVPISYVVANPSSYAYLDPERPSSEGNHELRPFADRGNCTTYDLWPYGLKNRTGYTEKIPDDQLKNQMAARPVTYLLGEIDILPLGGFDSSCPGMAQGPTRLARGQAFAAYVNGKYSAHHQLLVIPLCGHNARCMFTADPALAVLFPKI